MNTVHTPPVLVSLSSNDKQNNSKNQRDKRNINA